MDIPIDKDFPATAVQCDECGGWGCVICDQKGWLREGHPKGRRCEYGECNKPIPPAHEAVYCTDECAESDAA